MATNSAATRRANRDGHAYVTGVSANDKRGRCDACAHCVQAPNRHGLTSRDRLCLLHVAPVKTHGHCNQQTAKERL